MVSEAKRIKIWEATKRLRGATRQIAKRTGFTQQYVGMVLLARRHNMDIIETAAEVVKEMEARKKARVQKIEALADSIN